MVRKNEKLHQTTLQTTGETTDSDLKSDQLDL